MGELRNFLFLFLLCSCTQSKFSSSVQGVQSTQGAQAASDVLSPQFQCIAYKNSLGIWIGVTKNGQAFYDFRVGAGGAIAEFRRFNGEPSSILMGPSYPGNLTDRVIQQSLWSFKVQNPNPSAALLQKMGGQTPMLNVNQAGSATNTLTPTSWVEVEASTCTLRVFSIPQSEWMAENQNWWNSAYAMASEYKIVGDGQLRVRNLIMPLYFVASGALVNGQGTYGNQTTLPDLTLSTWVPFGSEFQYAANHLNSGGSPDWYYSLGNLGQNNFPVTSTYGFSVALDGKDSQTGFNVGLVFGTKSVTCVYPSKVTSCAAENISFALTSLGSDGPILVPNIYIRSAVPIGTLIDKTYFIFPFEGTTSSTETNLEQLAGTLNGPKVYYPGALPTQDAFINKIQLLIHKGATYQSDNLSPLAP